MIDLKTYDVFFINDINGNHWFTLTYDNLCNKIKALSMLLSPNFTIDCYRWDNSVKHNRGELCDGVVVLGTDYFKIFHEKNTNITIDIPCDHCKHRKNKITCNTHCLVWSSNM